MTESEAIDSAVTKEREEGKYLLNRFRRQISEFEEEYQMKTESFIKKFDSGELGDKEDYFEWKAIWRAVKHWENKLAELEKAS